MKNKDLIDTSKQHTVEELCNMAEKNPIVKKLIIFGSTVRNDCSIDSDIGICYDISCSTQDIRARELSIETARICDYNCDVFYYGIIGSELRHEIDANGIIIYEL